MDYRVEASRFDRLAWHELLRGSERRLDGRVVVLGAEFTGSGDRHRAPGPGRLAADLSGLTLQGIAIDTLLRGRPVRELAARVVWVGMAALLAVTTMALVSMTRLSSAWIAAAGGLAVWVSAAVVAFANGRVAPVAAPALLWGAAAGLGLAFRLRLPAPPVARVRSRL
jgi:CHASE2 domain-containing sensor protein